MADRTRLRLKRISRIALVDKGDNPLADVVIHKRAPDPGIGEKVAKALDRLRKGLEDALTFGEARGQRKANEELWQMTDALTTAIRNTLQSEEGDKAELIEQSIDEFAAAMKDALPSWMAGQPAEKTETGRSEMAEATKQEQPTTEPAGEPKAAEDVTAKAALEAMQKRLDDAEKRAQESADRVAKLEEDREIARHVERVSKLAHLPIEADKFGPILRKVERALSEDEFAEMGRVLDAANEANRTAKLFSEIGSESAPEGSAMAKAEALAGKKREADPTLTPEAALGEVFRENVALRREVEREEADANAARAARR